MQRLITSNKTIIGIPISWKNIYNLYLNIEHLQIQPKSIKTKKYVYFKQLIERNQITDIYLWKDGTRLTESDKLFLVWNLLDRSFFMEQAVLKPRVCKSSLSQVSSSHARETSKWSVLKNDSLLLEDIQNLLERRKKHSSNVLICYLNINSLRYKMVDLWLLLTKFLPNDFLLEETKLDQSFLYSQFVIDQYEIRIWDRNKNGGRFTK